MEEDGGAAPRGSPAPRPSPSPLPAVGPPPAWSERVREGGREGALPPSPPWRKDAAGEGARAGER